MNRTPGNSCGWLVRLQPMGTACARPRALFKMLVMASTLTIPVSGSVQHARAQVPAIPTSPPIAVVGLAAGARQDPRNPERGVELHTGQGLVRDSSSEMWIDIR